MGWSKYLVHNELKVMFEVHRYSTDGIGDLEDIDWTEHFIEYFSGDEIEEYNLQILEFLWRKTCIFSMYDFQVVALKSLYGDMLEITDTDPRFDDYIEKGYKAIFMNE